jgi:flagellar FliL protein
MSDDADLDLDGEDSGSTGAAKKTSGLGALLPNLLKFVAIGLGALIFIVTVSVITFNTMNKGGRSQTNIPISSPFVGTRPTFQYFTLIGQVRTSTKDAVPRSVVVDMIIGYDELDNATSQELTSRVHELHDFVRVYFKSKTAEELNPDNEGKIKQEILEQLNRRLLNSGRARIILFKQLDVMQLN